MGVPETRYTNSDGYIAYQVFGEGPIDLVNVGAWCSNVDTQWDVPSQADFLTRLTRFARVVVFDKRGVGLSDPVPLSSLPTLEEWMDDLRAVLDAADIERAALYGRLGGGLGCMLFAATHPDRTAALVLHDVYASGAEELRTIGITDLDSFLDHAVANWPRAQGFWSPADPAQGPLYAKYLRSCASLGMLAAILRMSSSVDIRHVLESIRAPTLVVNSLEQYRELCADVRQHIGGAEFIHISTPAPNRREHSQLTDAIAEFLTGVRPPPEVDRVLATVLFVDMVDSTGTAATLGDRAWRDLLERFCSAVRAELHSFRGREINTRGDDFLATFDGPARAISCARSVRERAADLGVRVTSGLHTGEVELIGDDIGGIAVHIGARVAALAAPDEILVSGAVPPLLAGSGIDFDDHGEHQLKGVPGAWRLFAVRD